MRGTSFPPRRARAARRPSPAPARGVVALAAALESRRLLAGGPASGVVFHDVDGSGFRESAAEPLLTVAGAFVYSDLNGNRARDAAEPSAAVTNGAFSLHLEPGEHTIRLSPPPGYRAVFPRTNAYSVTARDNWSGSGYMFGASTTGVATVHTFNDLDDDGVHDPGELPLAGRTVYHDLNQNVRLDPGEASRVTAADGSARFDGVPAGEQTFRQVMPPGWTGQGSGETTVFSAAGANPLRLGSRQPPGTATIRGTVWEDVNANRFRGSEDAGIPGRTVYFDADDDGVLDPGEISTTTDAAGRYSFAVPAPGFWVVRQVVPSGWSQTTPLDYNASLTGPDGHRVSINSDQQFARDFGTARAAPASISGQTYYDLDADGARDANETGPGPQAIAYLDFESDGRMEGGARVPTDLEGRFTFPHLPPGTYTVRVARTIGNPFLAQTDPPADDYGVIGGRVVTVAAGQAATGVGFGFADWASFAYIQGRVYHDANGNGSRDPDEQATVPGATVYLDADNDGALDAGERRFHTTGTDAPFYFDGLAPGTYHVRLVRPPNYNATSPASNAARTFTLAAGQRVGDADFGVRPAGAVGTITGTVYSDTYGDGENGVGDRAWYNQTVYLDADNDGALDPTERSTRTVAPGGSYTFTGLSAGTYVVRAAPIPGRLQSGPSGGAPHTITLASGQTSAGNDFGFVEASRLGAVHGVVFEDANRNGRRDAGEVAPYGRAVWIDADDDGVPDGGERTATQGATPGVEGYSFGGLMHGELFIRPRLPLGYRQTAPTQTSHAWGFAQLDQDSPVEDIGIAPAALSGTISGTLFHDADRDGVHDLTGRPGQPDWEPGQQGWTVFLDLNDNGAPDADEPTRVTDGTGRYLLNGVPFGTYTLRTRKPVGWENTSVPVPERTVSVEGGPGLVVDLPTYVAAGNVAVTVFDDGDGDGVRDAGEPGIADWRVYIDANRNGALDAGETADNTNAAGSVTFNDLIVGTVRIGQVGRTGWRPTTQIGSSVDAVVAEGGTTQVVFGNNQFVTTAAIAGYVYLDSDADAVKDGDESGLSNQVVYVDADNDGQFDQATERFARAAGDGRYEILGVPVGTLVVRQLLITGYVQTDPPGRDAAGAPLGRTVTTTRGEITDGVNFGSVHNSRLSRVSGIVFIDRNANGVLDFDLGENGPDNTPAGVVVYLDADNDGRLDAGERSVQSLGHNGYAVRDLSPGTYHVRVVPPSGYVQSLPAAGAAHTVTVGFSESVVGRHFGLAPAPEPVVTTLPAAADAYVRDGTSADTKYGTAAELQVKKSSAAGLQRESYLRFDLSGVSSADRATLRLFGALQSASGESIALGVYPSVDVAWPEADVTWNTRPAAGATALATRTVSGTTPQWHEWDVTDYVRAQKAAGAAFVTLAVKGLANSSAYVRFASDEAADAATGPQLVVESLPPVDRVAPTVTEVLWLGSNWTAEFLAGLGGLGLGTGGYRLQEPGAVPRRLPWTGPGQVVVRFSEDVRVQADDLRVTGTGARDYPVGGFVYDPATFTARWTISPGTDVAERLTINLDGDGGSGVTDSAGNKLRGGGPTGNDSGPSDHVRVVELLTGDANGDGVVNAQDVADVKRRLTRRPGDGVSDPLLAYSAFADVNGDGNTNALDIAAVKRMLTRRVPTEPAPAPAALLFSDERLL